MAKRLFLMLISSLVGLVFEANYLSATDTIEIKKPGFDAVETIIRPVVIENTNPISSNAPVIKAATPVRAAAVPALPANYISIAGRTLEVINVTDTAIDSGKRVNRYGSNFLYGHNTSAVFGGLVNLGVGSKFSMTLGSTTTNYRIARVVVFEKNITNGLLQLNGDGNYMRRVADAYFDGVQYSLSLMTCHGTSYGNGDASHRLVLFAEAV